MDEKKYNEQTEDKKNREKRDIRQYLTIALVVFVTFCCCILFFFMIYRYNGFTDFWKKFTGILQPIIIGLVLAYLLNPVMKFQEHYLLKLFVPRFKSEQKAKKMARGIGIAGSLVFLVLIFVLLIATIVPSVIASIQEIIGTLPQGTRQLVQYVDDFTKGETQVAEIANQIMEKVTVWVQKFWEEDVLTQIQTYISQVTSGVIYGVKFLLNIVIGIIVSVYILGSKETFAGQAKKIVYAIFKPVRANVIVKTVRKSNEIFGGFVSGKLLDSAIIGVLTYIVLAIMKMPDTMLVAVIIGVTNIIPFFGPFIGAIPSFLIIVLQDPIKGLYFLIFVIILQQVDGNIIGPKILGNSTGLSSFWVVFSILVFGGLWGFFGMLLGVPIMAVIYYIVEQLVEYFLKKRGLRVDTESYVKLTSVDEDSNKLIYQSKKTHKGKEKTSEKETAEEIEKTKE